MLALRLTGEEASAASPPTSSGNESKEETLATDWRFRIEVGVGNEIRRNGR